MELARRPGVPLGTVFFDTLKILGRSRPVARAERLCGVLFCSLRGETGTIRSALREGTDRRRR